MIGVLKHITVNRTASDRYDPTHTTTLRNMFVRESNRRFEGVVRLIRKAVDEEDVFCLRLQNLQATTPGKNAYLFLSDEKKVSEFILWLEELIRAEIIEVWEIPQGENLRNWLYKYLDNAYKRGVARAREELRKVGYNVPTIVASGGITTVMQAPIHVDKVALLYTRAFNDLKGVTQQMQQHIGRLLADGLLRGTNPRVLARRLVASVNGKGVGDLGITDTLGRFIPAKRRAEILARTEIIRAHHYGNIMEYKSWGAYGVSVRAEWSTAGDDRVCPKCASLEGKVFTLDEILPMIPLHPMCRCCAIPLTKRIGEE